MLGTSKGKGGASSSVAVPAPQGGISYGDGRGGGVTWLGSSNDGGGGAGGDGGGWNGGALPAAPANGYGGGSWDGGASGGASGGGSGAAPSLTLHADTNAALNALSSRYDRHLDNLEGNTGQIMDTAASRIRDAREGGRRAMQEDALFANKASDPALGSYDAATAGLQSGAIADIAATREGNLTNALVGGVGVMGAPAELALREKGLQIGAYQAETGARAAANNMAFQQYLALLNARRSSPIYTG